MYINTKWCVNGVLISNYSIAAGVCDCLMQTIVFTEELYIPPNANANDAMAKLYRAISEPQNAHLDVLLPVSGNFNHANLMSVLPKFYQYVDFPMRGVNILDCVYTNITSMYLIGLIRCAEPVHD